MRQKVGFAIANATFVTVGWSYGRMGAYSQCRLQRRTQVRWKWESMNGSEEPGILMAALQLLLYSSRLIGRL